MKSSFFKKFLSTLSPGDYKSEKKDSNKARDIQYTVKSCRAFLQNGQIHQAEKLAKNALPQNLYDRGLLTVLHHIAGAYFQYDIGYYYAEHAWYAGEGNTFHAQLLARASVRVAAPLSEDIQEALSRYIPDPLLLSRITDVKKACEVFIPFGGDEFLRTAAPSDIVKKLNEWNQGCNVVIAMDRILRAIFHNRHPIILHYAMDFIQNRVKNYYYKAYVTWLNTSNKIDSNEAYCNYARILLSASHFEKAMEYITFSGGERVLLEVLEQHSDKEEYIDYSFFKSRPNKYITQENLFLPRKKVLELIKKNYDKKEFLHFYSQLKEEKFSKISSELLNGYLHTPFIINRETPGNIKIAICISGQFRNPSTSASIIRDLKKSFDVDYFVSTWDRSPKTESADKNMYRHFPREIITSISESYRVSEMLLSLFPSINLKSEAWYDLSEGIVRNFYPNAETRLFKEENFADKIKNMEIGKKNINQLKMFYLMYQCHKMVIDRMVNSGIKYDIVVRVRPDLLLDKNHGLTLESFQEVLSFSEKRRNGTPYWIKTTAYTCHARSYGLYDPLGISDVFAFGNEHSMRIYTSVWPFIYFNDTVTYTPYISSALQTEEIYGHQLLFEHYFQHGGATRLLGKNSQNGFSSEYLTPAQMLSDFSLFCLTPERLHTAGFPQAELTTLWEAIQSLCVKEGVTIEAAQKDQVEAAIASVGA